MVGNIELLSTSTVPIVRHDEGEVKCSDTVTGDTDIAALSVLPCSKDGNDGTASEDTGSEVVSEGDGDDILEDDGEGDILTDFGEQGREEDPSSPDK
jgi:hypothetical protein